MRSYLNLLQHVLDNGEQHDDRTGVGTLSVFGYQWRHDLREGFPLLTTKKVFFRGVAEELFWFLSGSTNVQPLQEKGVKIWDEWGTKEQCAKFGRLAGDLGPIYGHQWRNYGATLIHNSGDGIPRPESYANDGVDQITQLVKDIQDSPNSRRLIVSGWHPREQKLVTLPPCHTLFQFKIHADGRLSCHLYARSIDAFLDLPFNIASYALLTCLIARCTRHGVGDLVISFGDLHIYKSHLEQVEEQLSRSTRTLPLLEIRHRLLGSGIDGLLSATYDDVQIDGYQPHPAIKAEVAV